jgi:EAL domain-containing protein (putative c-di-GMP-specific phosphodiesterase class I)
MPVIMVTGEATVATAIEAIEHGAFKYLLKPVRFEDLAESTKKAVQLQRLHRAKREAVGMIEKLEAPERAGLADRFESALSSLWPAFQPIVSADTGRLFGFEALLRTDEPSMPHPECVLDAAEHLGQLRRLGRAMRTAAANGLGALDGSAHIFVNLHPEDLNDPNLLETSSDIAASAPRIVLEITERMALDAVPNVREKVALLREMGFRIAIDDLGAGYAGLNSFVSLEPEFVKLDMSLTRGIEQCRIRQKLVGSMTSVCRDMGMVVVAEGIETSHERDALVDLDCDLLQGYFFGRPSRMPPPRND